MILLTEAEENAEEKDLTFENAIDEKYSKFFQHVKEFGYGMLVFPSVVKQLKGNYFIQDNVDEPIQGSEDH